MPGYFVGVAHPVRTPGMKDGLSRKDLGDLIDRFNGIPVTYAHRGIPSFLESTKYVTVLSKRVLHETFDKLRKVHPTYGKFGSVKKAGLTPDGAMIILFEVTSSPMVKLIKSSALNNLSLTWTHSQVGKHNYVDPIELTVCCTKPRLNHCHIIMGSPSMSALEPYMRTLCSARSGVATRLERATAPIPYIMSAEEAQPAEAERQPELTPDQKAAEILERIPNEGDRAMVHDTIVNFQTQTRKKEAEFQKEISELKKRLQSSDDDSAVIVDAVTTLITQLDPETAKRNNITTDQIADILRGKNMKQRDQAVARVCQVHSIQMAALLSNQQQPQQLNHKRPRQMPEARPMEYTPTNSSDSDVLTRGQFADFFASAWKTPA